MLRAAISLAVFAGLTAPTLAIAQDEAAPQRRISFGAAAADPDSEAANIRFSQCESAGEGEGESAGDLVQTGGTEPTDYDANGARIVSDCGRDFRQPVASTQNDVETETRSDCDGGRCSASVAIGESEEARENARQALGRAMEE